MRCCSTFRCFAVALIAGSLNAGALVGGPVATAFAAEAKRSLPRFVSLRANEVNVRTGPGTRFPIKWVLKRRSLPVEIVAEFENWRKIRDWQNGTGWVHQSTLTGKRTVFIVDRTRTLRREPSKRAAPVARAEPKVIGRLLACNGRWCRVQILGYRGWLLRTEFWGVYPDETVK